MSRTATAALIALFVPVAALVALGLGSSGLGPAEVASGLFGDGDEATVRIVRDFRLPRVVLGLLVGASLSVSGVLFQALLRNDLAEPYLLGVGPGALLGVTIAALVGGAAGAGTMPGPVLRGLFAFVGAACVTAAVLSYARRAGAMVTTTVLLAGIAIGAFVSAVATAALHAAVRDWHHVVRWLLGDLGLSDFRESGVLAVVLAVAGALAFVRARELDVLSLGGESAWLGGVEVRRALWGLGEAACLLAAAAVALSGLVGFVGLAVPHLARRMVGPGHRRLIPAAMCLGAGLVALADGVSRVAFPPSGLPLGVVTAVLGAPVLAVLLLRR